MKRTTTNILIGLTLVASATVAHSTMTFALTETQQTRLTTIVTKGDQEITRRLSALNKLAATITSTVKLSTTDKQLLSTEVTSATTGLTQLKSKLDAETTLDAAREDAKSLVTQYRVYALVTPKVHLVKVADGQILVGTKLTELATKLQQRISDLKTTGKNTSTLESTLSSALAKIVAAQMLSSSVQAKVIALQPTDYNSDHTILVGMNTQLKTAHQDLVDARAGMKTAITAIKTLETK